MSASEIVLISATLPSTGASTADDFDFPVALPGTWELVSFYYSPDTADAADATNYTTLTIETMDVVANLVACTGTISNAATAFTVGTARSASLGGAAKKVSQGDTVRVAKTEAGTGGILHGGIVITARKVPENP